MKSDSQEDDKTSSVLQQVEFKKVKTDLAGVDETDTDSPSTDDEEEVLTQEPSQQQDSIAYRRPYRKIRRPICFVDMVAYALPIVDDDVPSTYREALSLHDEIRLDDKIKQPHTLANAIVIADSGSNIASLRTLRVYSRTCALEQMVQAASSSAGLRTVKRVEQILHDLGVNMKPIVPIKAVCAEHLDLSKEILTLLNLQKQPLSHVFVYPSSLLFRVVVTPHGTLTATLWANVGSRVSRNGSGKSATTVILWDRVLAFFGDGYRLDSIASMCSPSFNEAKHNVFSSELKQLHVAITRTRQRLWIWEHMAELSKPMFDYWKKRSLLQVRQLDDKPAQAMQIRSSPEEWKSQGIKDTNWEQMSKATGLKVKADHICSSNPQEANAILREAAEMFETIGRGQSFSECLAACSEGKLFDVGFKYINKWKQHAHTVADLTRRSEEMNKIEQEFQQSCTRHCHELKDNEFMVKVVREFHSIDLKRHLLNSLNCFDKLLVLEEESGSYIAVANIAKTEKRYSSDGWALKLFAQEKKFLGNAKSLAKNESKQFYEFVCTEVDILSDDQNELMRMIQQLNASKRHQNITGESLSARKIPDFHLHKSFSEYVLEDGLNLDLTKYPEDKICKNGVSVQTLVYFWDCCKDKIANVLEYLGCLQSQDINNYRSNGDFCLSDLGVWKKYNNPNTIDLLLNSDADWARKLGSINAPRSGKLASISDNRLVSDGRR
ncbi:hypothetical protein KPL70_023178 [Citrus sinensis]|nr:hypothetical protein KPL70_023178 [Citrus sinensis]